MIFSTTGYGIAKYDNPEELSVSDRNIQLIGKLFLTPSILAAEKGNFFG